MLRYLFGRLIDEELHRDATYRDEMSAKSSRPNSIHRTNAPPAIQMPFESPQPSTEDIQDDTVTPKAVNGIAGTPGLTIGVATPVANGVHHSPNPQAANQIPATIDENTTLEKHASQQSATRNSTDKSPDYFSSNPQVRPTAEGQIKAPTTPGETGADASATTSPTDGDKDEKAGSSLFGKKFRMNFPKKLGRTSAEVKPTTVDEKSEESDKSDDKEERNIEEDKFYGTIQQMHYDYEEMLQSARSQPLYSLMHPSSKIETPPLHHPPHTIVIIQEERPDAGGAADLYRGTVSSVGNDADLIEKAAPRWLGELLLRVSLGDILAVHHSTDDVEQITRKGNAKGIFHPPSVPGSLA